MVHMGHEARYILGILGRTEDILEETVEIIT